MNYLRAFLPEKSRQYREETAQRITWGHWFALFNILIALFIAARYAFNADWPNTLAGKLYFFTSLFGHFSFVVFGVYLLTLFPLSFIIKNHRAFRGISVMLATIGQTVLLVDTEVFKQFYLHLSPLVWDLLVNPDNAELSRQWQLLFVPMPIILLLEMLYSRWCWNKLRSFNRQRWGKCVAIFFVNCFIATHLLYAWADMAIYRPVTAQKANYPLSYPMTARSFLEKHHLLDRANLDQTIETSGRLDTFFLNYPRKPLQFGKKPTKINVLFINLSGLSQQTITAQDTPNLWKISQQSRLFTNHYTGGDSATAGIASLFYSLSGRYVDAILNEQQPSPFISRLQQLNYQFGLFSHNGFAEPIYRHALFAEIGLPSARNNAEAISQWQHWLAGRNTQPFFSYLDLQAQLDNVQKNGANFPLDQQVGKIWQSLEQQGLMHNTMIIITADIAHTENDNHRFSSTTTRVPMMIYWQQDQDIYNGLSSHLDIAPTLLSQFFGLTSPLEDYAQGIDLTKENHRKWLLLSNYRWNVAVLPNGEQYHLDRQGDFIHFDTEGSHQNRTRPPLALFLQLIQQANQFVEK